MRVSIVVTSFNYAPYVSAAIESALAQTHPDTEVIVVDDGSTDGSVAIVEGYADRARVVLKGNGGQASAVNAGFAASTGDAVIFLDADDLLAPEAAAETARLLGPPGVAKAHWPLELIDATGRATGAVWPDRELPDGDLSGRLLTSSPDYVTPPTSGNAYHRDMLEAVLPMPEPPFVTGADTYLFLLAPAFGEIRRADRPLARYRRHGDNNYSGKPFDERLAELRRWSDVTLDALEAHCARLGVAADPAAWRRRTWVYRVSAAAETIDGLVPEGTPFVLVDDGDWSMQADERRRPIPFLERDGVWWGRPPDDATAIAELDRLRRSGARYLVLGFPAFWWLDHYPAFAEHVNDAYEQLAADDELLIYDLAGRG